MPEELSDCLVFDTALAQRLRHNVPELMSRYGDADVALGCTPQALEHDADLLLGRELPARRTPDVLHDPSAGCFTGPDFCFIFAPDGYDEPEILPS